MGKTIIQKIFETHSETAATVNDIIDITIDVRVARDFGGANVVKHLEEHHLPIHDPKIRFSHLSATQEDAIKNTRKTSRYAVCSDGKHGIKTYDINSGIGTHLAFDEGLVFPGDTFVSTDSHANILGAQSAPPGLHIDEILLDYHADLFRAGARHIYIDDLA